MEFRNIISAAVSAAAPAAEYLIPANFVLAVCITAVFAVRFLARKYPVSVSFHCWGIVVFGLLYFTVRPLQLPVGRLWALFTDDPFSALQNGGREASGNSAKMQTGREGTEDAGPLSEHLLFPGNSGASDPDGVFRNPTLFPDLTDPVRNVRGEGISEAAHLPVMTALQDLVQDTRFTVVFCAVWFTGLLIFMLRRFCQHLEIRRRTQFAVRLRDNIFELDGCATPFVYGCFRAKIYVPCGLNEEELSLITAHETCHIRKKDHLLLPAAGLIADIFWINPLARIACRKFRLDVEMRCDECTTRDFSGEKKRAYSLLLLNMALSERASGAVRFSSEGSVLKRRIRNIMEKKKRKIALPVCVTAVCILILAVSISYAAANGNVLSGGEENDAGGQNGGQSSIAAIDQEAADQAWEQLGLQNSGIDMVILDESGRILAEKGDVHRKIAPGSAARPAIAAAVLADGRVNPDSVVRGNSIGCRNAQGTEDVYSNWRQEPEEMTFSQALTEWSQVGLISAVLESDFWDVQRTLDDQGFSHFDLTTESSIASCVTGQEMKVSVFDLADSYREIFSEEENQQLRELMKQALKQQCGDEYDDSMDISGAYGSGTEILSGDPADTDVPVKTAFTAAYVCDYDFGGQKVILAAGSYQEGSGDGTVMTGRDLMSASHAVLSYVTDPEALAAGSGNTEGTPTDSGEADDASAAKQEPADGEQTALTEETADSQEGEDLSNHVLDRFIGSVGDEERRELMTKYFYLGSKESDRIPEIKDLTLIEQAEILKEMPIEELRAAVERIERAYANKKF